MKEKEYKKWFLLSLIGAGLFLLVVLIEHEIIFPRYPGGLFTAPIWMQIILVIPIIITLWFSLYADKECRKIKSDSV